MSELQIGLLIIGVITIVVVLAYNKSQDLKYRRLAERKFSSAHDDALLDSDIPADEDAADSVPTAIHSAADRVEPVLVDEDTPAPPAPEPGLPRVPVSERGEIAAAPDERQAIEYAINLSSTDATDSGLFAAAVADIAGQISKRIRFEAWDDSRAGWSDSPEGVKSSKLRACLQLVDRQGAITPDELAKFRTLVSAVANVRGFAADSPDSAEALAQAGNLDEFCCEVDIQIVLNVMSRSGLFAGSKIRSLAEAEGFMLESDGVFRRRDDSGLCLFSIANDPGSFPVEAMKDFVTGAIVFQFDLPRVPDEIELFDQFCEVAGRFAAVLGGRMVDDNKVEISPKALQAIRSQIQHVHATMQERGFPAGSPIAFQLFS